MADDVKFLAQLIIDEKGNKINPFSDGEEMTPEAAALTVEELVQIFQRNARDLDADLFEQSMGRPFDDTQIVVKDSRYHGMIWVKFRCKELGVDLATELAKTKAAPKNDAEAYVRTIFDPLETWWTKRLLEPDEGESDGATVGEPPEGEGKPE